MLDKKHNFSIRYWCASGVVVRKLALELRDQFDSFVESLKTLKIDIHNSISAVFLSHRPMNTEIKPLHTKLTESVTGQLLINCRKFSKLSYIFKYLSVTK